MEKIQITTSGIRKSLQRFDSCSAISEYIWNGFDAGASRIQIQFDANEIGTISSMQIIDNGYGIDYRTEHVS